MIVAGTSNEHLATAVASLLGTQPVSRSVTVFPDGEVQFVVEEDLRDADVWIIQPTGPPVERHLFELLLLVDASRHAGSARVNAVVPYLGYARQDHRSVVGQALGARVVANLLAAAHLDRLVVIDPHSASVETMMAMPADVLSAAPTVAAALRPLLPDDAVVVAPDLGAVKRAETYAALLQLPVAHVRKARLSGTKVSARQVVGGVEGCTPVIVDDMISTGATIEAAVGALLAAGCTAPMVVAATHALLVGPATDTLAGLPLQRLVLTDTLVPSGALPANATVIPVAPLIAQSIAGAQQCGQPSA